MSRDGITVKHSSASRLSAGRGTIALKKSTVINIPAPIRKAFTPKNIESRANDFFVFAPATVKTVPINAVAIPLESSPIMTLSE